MPSPDYSAAVFPDRYRVCGVWLKPMTLGHALLLERIGSPFAPHAKNADQANVADLLIAAIICSVSWHRAQDLIQSWRVRLRVFLYSQTMRKTHERDAVTWASYVLGAFPTVNYWVEEEGEQSAIGLVQSLVIMERSRFNLTIEAALSVPCSVAMHDMYHGAEQSGKIRLWTDADYDLAESVRKEDANG